MEFYDLKYDNYVYKNGRWEKLLYKSKFITKEKIVKINKEFQKEAVIRKVGKRNGKL